MVDYKFYSEINFKQTEIGPMPQEWEVVKLGEVCDELKQGKILPTSKITNQYKFPVYGANGIIGYYDNYFVPPGKILITCRGSTCGEVNITISNAFVTNNSMILYEKSYLIINTYLYYVLIFYSTKNLRNGSGQPQITKGVLINHKIPLPPLDEQQAIAEVLQTIQEAKEKTEAVIKTTRQLKKSMMKHLFTYGVANFDFRLTNESNSNEINSQILNRQSQIKLKDTEIGPIPEHWKVVKLGEVAEKIFGGGTPSTKNHEFWGGHIPWTTSSIIKEDEIVLTNFQRTITEKGLKNSSTNIAPKGSLLLGTRVGVGKSIITNFDIAINQDLTAVVLKEKITNAYFLAYLFKSYYYKSWFEGNKRGATIKGIPREDLINLPIPLPPLSEQQAIANILQAIDDKIQKEEAKKKAIENLFKSMLNNLMSGRLRVRILNGGKNDTN